MAADQRRVMGSEAGEAGGGRSHTQSLVGAGKGLCFNPECGGKPFGSFILCMFRVNDDSCYMWKVDCAGSKSTLQTYKLRVCSNDPGRENAGLA